MLHKIRKWDAFAHLCPPFYRPQPAHFNSNIASFPSFKDPIDAYYEKYQLLILSYTYISFSIAGVFTRDLATNSFLQNGLLR